MINEMTNLEIEAFWAVATLGNLTKASESLYITQPALTRRIQSLEEELGYSLFVRQKGSRQISLTHAGQSFLYMAEEWLQLYKRFAEFTPGQSLKVFRVSALDSLNTCVMIHIYHNFMSATEDTRLHIMNLHSPEAYIKAEHNLLDLAFICDPQHTKYVETCPAFQETMFFLCNMDLTYPQIVDANSLNCEKMLFAQWTPEYELWVNHRFNACCTPYLNLENMTLIEKFLSTDDCWLIAPASVAHHLLKNPRIRMRALVNGPPNRIVYYLLPSKKKQEETTFFLRLLHKYLKGIPGVVSSLGNP